MKWIPLLMIAASVVAFIVAARMDRTASFESGTFLGEIGLAVIGIALLVIGIGWLIVLAFLKL